MTIIKRNKYGTFMVADLLEKGPLAPTKGYGQKPMWRPQNTPAALHKVMQTAHIPTLGWARPVADGTPMTDIDANAAYLAATSSASFAFSPLIRTGPHDCQRHYIYPGYYLVDSHHWNNVPPGSPLGSGQLPSRIWVTHNTYMNLRDLTFGSSWCEPGQWPDATAYDSWTCTSYCRFTEWVNRLRDFRADLIDAGDTESVEDLKLGYSQAIQMWATPPDPKGTPRDECQKKNHAYRPDWYHTVRSQAAFTMWRTAYRAAQLGHPPVALGGRGHTTDGMAFTSSDLRALLALPVSPIRLDETGVHLGTFSRSRPYLAGTDAIDEQ